MSYFGCSECATEVIAGIAIMVGIATVALPITRFASWSHRRAEEHGVSHSTRQCRKTIDVQPSSED
jgi:hypothetical protein